MRWYSVNRRYGIWYFVHICGLDCSSLHQTLTQAIRFRSWDIICSACPCIHLMGLHGHHSRYDGQVGSNCHRSMYALFSRVDQYQSIDEQHPVYKCSVNSSQQWQHGVWGAGQLVTTRCFSRRSTRHTILGCDELTVWRVDWHPILQLISQWH